MTDAVERCMYDVVICGAGPTGLVMALGLNDPDIKVLVISKHTKRSLNARAVNIWPRNIEDFYLYDRALYNAFAASSLDVTHWAMALDREYLQLRLQGLFPSKVAPNAFFLPQSDTEQILEDSLKSRSDSSWEFRQGWCLTQAKTNVDEKVIDLTIKDLSTGAERFIRSRYLLGCDGAKSVVRRMANVDFHELPNKAAAWIADGKLTFTRRGPGPDIMSTSMTQKIFFIQGSIGRAGFFIPIKKDLFRMAVLVPLDLVPEDSRPEPTVSEFNQKLSELRTNYLIQMSEAAFLASTRFWFGLCQTYSDITMRIFLAGDAAHVHSPMGGQGMNMSMQDAFNLSWKLRMCLKHPGVVREEPLLHSYELERRPIAQEIVKRTHAALNPSFSELTSRIFTWILVFVLRYTYKLVIAKGLRTMSQLDRNYAGTPLCTDEWRKNKWYYLWDSSGISAGYHIPFTDVKTAEKEKTYLASLCDHEGFALIYFPPKLPMSNSEGTSLLSCGAARDDVWLAFCEEYPSYKFSALISQIIVVDNATHGTQPTIETSLISAEDKKSKLTFVQDIDSRVKFVGNCAESCIYVIRPDYFIGFRSRPFQIDSLCAWFAKFT